MTPTDVIAENRKIRDKYEQRAIQNIGHLILMMGYESVFLEGIITGPKGRLSFVVQRRSGEIQILPSLMFIDINQGFLRHTEDYKNIWVEFGRAMIRKRRDWPQFPHAATIAAAQTGQEEGGE